MTYTPDLYNTYSLFLILWIQRLLSRSTPDVEKRTPTQSVTLPCTTSWRWEHSLLTKNTDQFPSVKTKIEICYWNLSQFFLNHKIKKGTLYTIKYQNIDLSTLNTDYWWCYNMMFDFLCSLWFWGTILTTATDFCLI